MWWLLNISIALLTYWKIIHAGNFYSIVETQVPLSGIIKTIPGVTKRVCMLKCRISKNCKYSAIDLDRADCLHLNKLSISNGERTLKVTLFQETSTERIYPGTYHFCKIL